MKIRSAVIAVIFLLTSLANAQSTPQPAPKTSTSTWAYVDPATHKLHYRADDHGNRITDFSYAGYGGGGVAIPSVRVAKTVKPIEGDNTSQIQAAIDAVAAMSADAKGFRGAVLLNPGTYELVGTLNITASGVVLRGSGANEKGTVIRLTEKPHRFLRIGGSGNWQTEGAPAKITDAYVPVGANSLTVNDAAGFHAGDTVLIRRPVTAAWIHFMQMDTLVRDGKPQTWIAAGSFVDTDRTIRAIKGNRVTLDVPLSDPIDAEFTKPDGAVMVRYTFPGRISQAGVENLRVEAPNLDVPISEGQFTLLQMSSVIDAWARDIDVRETQNAISINSSAKRVTLESIRIVHSGTHTGAAAPADFSLAGTQALVHRCSVTGDGTWPLVTQAKVTGPNVVLNFTTNERGVAPHQRWATGLLVDSSTFDNSTARAPGIAFSNRKTAGSGHGWDIGWAVAWNVTTPFLRVENPPGAINWCIGCRGEVVTDGVPVPGVFDALGSTVTPASLYLEQLRERLGEGAVKNIGYR